MVLITDQSIKFCTGIFFVMQTNLKGVLLSNHPVSFGTVPNFTKPQKLNLYLPIYFSCILIVLMLILPLGVVHSSQLSIAYLRRYGFNWVVTINVRATMIWKFLISQ